jgi:hypothetical protein
MGPDKLEEFKFGVELGKNVWLALVTLLTALYFRLPEVSE